MPVESGDLNQLHMDRVAHARNADHHDEQMDRMAPGHDEVEPEEQPRPCGIRLKREAEIAPRHELMLCVVRVLETFERKKYHAEDRGSQRAASWRCAWLPLPHCVRRV